MKGKLAYCLLFLLLLSGCAMKPQTTSDNPPSVPTATKAIGKAVGQTEETWKPVFQFRAQVLFADMPEFTFHVYESQYSGADDFLYVYKIVISCPAMDDYSPQTLEVPSSVKRLAERRAQFIDLIDIDFDGCADIQVETAEYNVDRLYQYYRWNYFAGQGYGEFETKPFFELLCHQYKLFPDTKQILSYTRGSALNYQRTMYQLGDTRNDGWLGTYSSIRSDEQSLEDDMITERAFFLNKEIFKKSVPVNDFSFERDTVSEDYLRFGTDGPISVEEAQIILYEGGTVAEDTGYPLSYTFEEMCMKDELSCYKFRVQWLVEDRYWSTIGFVGVTPDGRVFSAD